MLFGFVILKALFCAAVKTTCLYIFAPRNLMLSEHCDELFLKVLTKECEKVANLPDPKVEVYFVDHPPQA